MRFRVQGIEDKPWRTDEGIRSLEEGLPRLKEENLEKTSRRYKVTRGLGSAGFHPEVPLHL